MILVGKYYLIFCRKYVCLSDYVEVFEYCVLSEMYLFARGVVDLRPSDLSVSGDCFVCL